jgi:DNA helicase-2/ATP-dependent DNA helicase PcrA
MDEVPPELVQRIEPVFSTSSYQSSFRGDYGRTSPYGRRPPYRGRSRETPEFSYADEDQSSLLDLRLGAKVRHPQFGVGTILRVEALADDVKLVVRFSVGPKTLRAKYAKLEMV